MVQPLHTQISFPGASGQLDWYRSGSQGQIRNDGDVRQIDGFPIDLSGSGSTLVSNSRFESGKGIRTVDAAPHGALSPSTLGALIQIKANGDVNATQSADSSPYIASVQATISVSYTPIGAEPQSVELPGFIPGDVFKSGNATDYIKSQIARDGELAKTEINLRQQFGADVKLAFDPLSGEYMMLRPGQTGYDSVKSAQDVFAQIPSELQKMGYGNSHAFDDVLAQYSALLKSKST